MNDNSRFEARVAELIAAYADRAPIDVDPMAMTRLAAADVGRRAPAWVGFAPAGRGLGFALFVMATLATLVVGALIAGGQPFRRDPDEILTDRAFVEPFVGLPPVGVAPSTPETGELLLSFGGRVRSIGLDLHRVWLFADGRLIWKRNLDALTDTGRRAFGAREPTTAVIEQRLTREGTELMRSRVMAAGLHDFVPVGTRIDRAWWGRPGVLWGGLVVHDGERLVDADWSDSEMPALLADPTSWLPASAWEDQRIGGYVPSRHAVCLEPSGLIDVLPDPTKELILTRANRIAGPARNSEDLRCPYRVTTEDARAITATLAEAGLQPVPYLRYHIPFGPRRTPGWVEILPIVPHGDVVCDCG